MIEAIKGKIDLQANATLEEAFLWTLAYRAAVEGFLDFNNDIPAAKFHCQRIAPGRLFFEETAINEGMTITDRTLAAIAALEDGTMYFAAEPGRLDFLEAEKWKVLWFVFIIRHSCFVRYFLTRFSNNNINNCNMRIIIYNIYICMFLF